MQQNKRGACPTPFINDSAILSTNKRSYTNDILHQSVRPSVRQSVDESEVRVSKVRGIGAGTVKTVESRHSSNHETKFCLFDASLQPPKVTKSGGNLINA